MKKRTMILAGIMLLFSLALVAKSADNLLCFDISPNPMDDVCEIKIDFADVTAITLVVQNEKGNVIKTIYSGPVHKMGFFKWYRDDAMGNWVAPGTYYVVINYHSRYTSTKKTLILK